MFNTILHYIFVAFFVVFFFGFCIFIHELGHFLAAKWRKLHIVAFSIGFKKIWCFKHKGIEYRIGCLPFGGYVDLPQFEPKNEIKGNSDNQLPPISPLDRIIVAFAGPFFNILFGLFLGTFLWIHGLPESTPRMSSINVAEVVQNSPEYKAGLREGDKIIRINGDRFYCSWNQILQKFIFTVGKVNLEVKAENSSLKNIHYLPRVNSNTPEAAMYAKEGLPYPSFSPAIPIIIQVEPNSAAAKIGLKTDDRIIKINDKKPLDYIDFIRALDSTEGKPVSITVVRKNKDIKIKNITPAKYKESPERYLLGVYPVQNSKGVYISDVIPDSAASTAGIRKGDIIVSIDNLHISAPLELNQIIAKSKDKELNIKIIRNNKIISIKAAPRLAKQNIYYIPGIAVTFYNHINPFEQFYNVIMMSYNSIKGILSKRGNIKAKHLSGPVGIITVIGKAVYMGMIVQALHIVTVITFALAIMNLLPLPILDGGHILISIIEMITRRRIPATLMQPVCMLFAILLIALMLFATYNDFDRIFNFNKMFSSKESTSLKTEKLQP